MQAACRDTCIPKREKEGELYTPSGLLKKRCRKKRKEKKCTKPKYLHQKLLDNGKIQKILKISLVLQSNRIKNL